MYQVTKLRAPVAPQAEVWDEDGEWGDVDLPTFDEDGYCTSDYGLCGSYPETVWEVMARRIAITHHVV